MAPASESSDTLRGYDIVLSLSQEAINAQFRDLYNKPLPGGRAPPPPGLKKFQPAPIPEYYINHNLFIFPPPDPVPSPLNPDEEPVGPQTVATSLPPLGLRAHIECPQFEFHPTNPNTLIMSITFKAMPWTPELAKLMGDDPAQPPKEEEVQETTVNSNGQTEAKKVMKRMSHSKMSFMKSTGNAAAIKADGWTVSWEVSVAVKDIENIMDIVTASRNPQDVTLIVPEVEKQLEDKFKSVDTTKFTASSVFCLFQTAQIASSFKLVGPNGEMPTGDERAAMTLRISQYFGELQKQYDGKPTADTPYLLGYGIKATTPKLEVVNQDLKTRTATPGYFIPRRFDVTTTPSKIDDDKKFTKGTLNFCMQTYRAKSEDQVALQVTDEGKGRFEHPFFSTTQTPAIGTKGSDGIMGFSRQILNLWLISFLDRFKADPNALLKNAAEAVDNKGSLNVTQNDFSQQPWQQGLGVKGSTLFKASADVDPSKTPLNQQNAVDTRRVFTGDSTTLIKYTSDLQVDQSKATKDGAYRRVLLDYVFYFDLVGFYEAKFDDNFWANFHVAKLRSQYKVGFVLQPGEGGVWSLTKDNDRSNVPAKGAEQVQKFETEGENDDHSPKENPDPNEYTQMTLGSDKYGTVLITGPVDANSAMERYKSKHDNEILFIDGTPMNSMVNSVDASREVHLGDIENGMKGIFNSLKTTVILPAGNVFTFKTTDTDGAGHLYTGLTYRPPTELKKV